MKDLPNNNNKARELRKRAEEKLQKSPADSSELRPENFSAILHELRVHQIELELQNEELRRNQAELEAVRDLYFDLYDLAPVGYLSLNQQGTITRANLTAATMLGVTRNELLNKALVRFIEPEHQDNFVAFRMKMLAGYANNDCELEVISAKAEPFPAILQGAPEQDTEGNYTGWRVAILDISERKKSEAALLDSEEKFRLAFDNANIGVYLVSTAGVFLKVNQRFCDFLGYSKEELLGRGVNDFAHPDDMDLSLDFRRRSLAGETGDAVFSKRYFHKQGHLVHGQISSALVHDSKGDPLYFISHVRDITRRRQIEKEKTGLEKKLRQSQKMEAIGTLAGGIAHDFNNILAAIVGYTELTLDDLPEGGQPAGNLKKVLKASDRAKNLVRQILSFSRKTELDYTSIAVAAIVEEALAFIRPALPATIDIKQDLEDTQGRVMADPVQIHQVILNLCNNAAQAMEQKGGLLEINLRQVDIGEQDAPSYGDLEPGSYFRLTVNDTGMGMNTDTLSHAFEPFFTTKDIGQGTGMGLAVVYGIIKSHGGAITAYSEPGRGATFNVYLPVWEGPDIPAASVAPEVGPLTGTERIMLVDDEVVLAETGSKALKRLGYGVTAFTSSVEALARFKSHPDDFDLLVTDYTMPQMTGFDLAREMLRIRPSLPIIITTGFNHQLTEEKARAIGIRRTLMKPYAGTQIAQIIRQVLKANDDQKKPH